MNEDNYIINSVDESKATIKLNTTTEGVPTFLKQQMSFSEKSSVLNFFSNLFCISSSKKKIQDIGDDELEAFYDLKRFAFTNYDDSESNHEQSLRFLYLSTIKGNLQNDLITDEWQKVGFETNNPREEFKEGGYLALLLMNYFVKSFSDEYMEIINYNKENPKTVFHFAKSAIIVSEYCKLALGQFYEKNVKMSNASNTQKIKPITVKQFISFMTQQNHDVNYIYRLLSIILVNAFNKKKNAKTLPKDETELMKDSFNEEFYMELDLYNVDDDIAYSNESANSSLLY